MKKPLGKINSGCLTLNGHPLQPKRHCKNSQKGQRSCEEMGTEMNVFSNWCCSDLFQGMRSKTGKPLHGLFDAHGQRGPPQGREPACCVSLLPQAILTVSFPPRHILPQYRSQDCYTASCRTGHPRQDRSTVGPKRRKAEQTGTMPRRHYHG